MLTYRNDVAYQFCPGCSHGLVLDALDRALGRMHGRYGNAWDPDRIVIVTDIGCVGLSDQHFITSGFHGLHGRSLTYAAGIKLARPDLQVINLIGDGGCGIGGTHLINIARRDIAVTTLVLNNLNFGMTGGEHSVTTPSQQKTSTTPWGNTEVPLDIAATVAANGATFVWRGTAYTPDLDRHIEAALSHEGFSLLDIWELCTAYYASLNKVSPRELTTEIARLGFEEGWLQTKARPVGTVQLKRDQLSRTGQPIPPTNPIDLQFKSGLEEDISLMIAGSAGGHIRTAARLICIAATMSGLWTTQRDDYPVTVRSGHSLSEIKIAPEPILYTACQDIDILFVLDEQGLGKVRKQLTIAATGASGQLCLFVTLDLVDRVKELLGERASDEAHPFGKETPMLRPPCEPENAAQSGRDVTFQNTRAPGMRIYGIDIRGLQGIARASQGLAIVAAGLAYAGILSPDALVAAAAALNPTYAKTNQEAVSKALNALNTVVLPML
jgi:2-oxoglutarate/2-oxoacid ferredoxin oxidoreductase subunit beta